MVGRDDLMNAIALNSSMVNGARIIGPAIAGLLVAAVGEGWCFLIDGVSYFAVIASLLLMRITQVEGRRHTAGIISRPTGITLSLPQQPQKLSTAPRVPRRRDAARALAK